MTTNEMVTAEVKASMVAKMEGSGRVTGKKAAKLAKVFEAKAANESDPVLRLKWLDAAALLAPGRWQAVSPALAARMLRDAGLAQ